MVNRTNFGEYLEAFPHNFHALIVEYLSYYHEGPESFYLVFCTPISDSTYSSSLAFKIGCSQPSFAMLTFSVIISQFSKVLLKFPKVLYSDRSQSTFLSMTFQPTHLPSTSFIQVIEKTTKTVVSYTLPWILFTVGLLTIN